LANIDDSNDEGQQWFPKRQEVVSDPASISTFDILNIIIKCGHQLNKEEH